MASGITSESFGVAGRNPRQQHHQATDHGHRDAGREREPESAELLFRRQAQQSHLAGQEGQFERNDGGHEEDGEEQRIDPQFTGFGVEVVGGVYPGAEGGQGSGGGVDETGGNRLS